MKFCGRIRAICRWFWRIAHKPLPMIRFSIATVCYNAGHLIGRTIKSVESQDYPGVEHLIIDGNSQDETLALIHFYQQRNSLAGVQHEIVCRSEPDGGIYDAMNKALRLASGDYILFLNAGDTFHGNTVLSDIAAQLSGYAGRRQCPAVLYGHTDIVDRDGAFVSHRRLAPPERLTWQSFKSGMLVCHQAFFARLDVARKFPYDHEKYRFSADFDWCIRIMREAERLKLPLWNTHLVVADYLEGGVSVQHHRDSLLERYDIMCHHYGKLTTLLQHCWFVVRSVLK